MVEDLLIATGYGLPPLTDYDLTYRSCIQQFDTESQLPLACLGDGLLVSEFHMLVLVLDWTSLLDLFAELVLPAFEDRLTSDMT